MPRRPLTAGLELRALAVIAAMTVVLLATAASPGYGHTHLLETEPADGATLDTAPEVVVLTFDEPVEPAGNALTLTDGDGIDHALAAAVGPAPGQIQADVPADVAPGEHVIAWRIVAQDGHTQEDAFGFTVVEADAAESDDDQVEHDPSPEGDANDVSIEAGSAEDEGALGESAETAGDGGMPGWVMGMIVLLVAAVAAGALLLGRRGDRAADEP